MERNIRLVTAYDGTDFNGWQIQKQGERTIQGVMQESLGRMHKHPVRVIASGRTDSGVHALGQVVNFRTDITSIDPERFAEAVNSFLPKDVQAVSSDEVDYDFHSRFDAKRRTYRYYILPGTVCLPWQRRFCHHIKRLPDVRNLNGMAGCLVGEHDFAAFASPDEERRSTVRRVLASSFFFDGGYLVYGITGNAFLWKMVRTIVGTLLELDATGGDSGEVRRILASMDRSQGGPTAPARGLFLHRVEYDEEREI
jgi:tRNA pseudouridine38-40 synthase